MVMFDTLNRRMLPPYGADDMVTPNFARLADVAVTFDNCYAASMPCMPARREMHTARYNFLHRSWGPIEPFDDSIPEILSQHGIHTHLATDHQHYWEDGGATYHTRYTTAEFFRGQEGDRWKGRVQLPERGDTLNPENFLSRQDRVNRLYLTDEADHPETLTFDAGIHFIETNADAGNWFVQIETFDPHEPFFTYEPYLSLYGDPLPSGPDFDWPPYRRVIENQTEIDRARQHYKALVSQCDHSLGRVLEVFDRLHLWDNTLLIVCTDHGYFLGERGWWGKSVQPWFDETIHTPLFVWDPRLGKAGERRDALVQTIDFGPTLLDYFDIDLTTDMQGRPLASVISTGEPIRTAGLFGNHGGHVSVTDGHYVYMRACVRPTNDPLYEYTLMPTHMRARFNPAELRDAELVEPFSFTKDVPVLRTRAVTMGSPYVHGTLLFDMVADPHQQHPLRDESVELRMAQLLVDEMRANDAPAEQFDRLGLPVTGPVGSEHLLVAAQWELSQRALTPAPRREDFTPDSPVNTLTLSAAIDSDDLRAALGDLPERAGGMRHFMPDATIIEVLAMRPDVGLDEAIRINRALEAAMGAGGE
jgi:arylsulfatase A-like enzyme